MPLAASQAIFSSSQKPTSTPLTLPLTQSAASMVRSANTKRFSTYCAAVDKILGGGLLQGHILEISGPPGTFKERLAVNVVRSFVESDAHVLFVGMCQTDSIFSHTICTPL